MPGRAEERGGEAIDGRTQGDYPAHRCRAPAAEQPRDARAALRAGFHSLPAVTISHLFRRIPPVSSTPNAEPEAARRPGEAERVSHVDKQRGAVRGLHDLAAVGCRGHGRGVSGPASPVAAARRHQGAGGGGHGGSRVSRKVQPRGRSRRDAVASPRRRRPRSWRIQRSPLDFDGLRRGHRCLPAGERALPGRDADP